MRYVSLHTHSTFSFGDGYGPVRDHVQRVKDLGMSAVALTEHGNTSSHVQLEKACREFSIKPIYGIEAYVSTPDEKLKTHLILLATNEIGYQNLNRIVTASWSDEKKGRFPTVYWSRLEEFNEGLIVLSGCSDSELSCTLLGGKSYGDKRFDYTDEQLTAAIGVVERYHEVFEDRYYIECQRFPRLRRTCVLNVAFAQISTITDVPIVGTCDIHYPQPTDNTMQTLLHAAHRGSSVEAAEASWEYDILLTYPTSDEEVTEDLIATGLTRPEATCAVFNTALIAERCNVVLPRVERIRYPIAQDDWDQW